MGQQFSFPLPTLASMGLEDFLPAPANQEALRWLLQTPCAVWPSHAFLLIGAEASGKSHLLSLWCEKTGARRVTLGDTAGLQSLVTGESKEPAFALDDADACAGNGPQEEWLQHFFNASKAAERPFLMTASAPPAQWGLRLPDIATRLKSCASATIGAPDDELMRGLLLKQFRDRQLLVEGGVVDYIAARIERSAAAARRAVALLDEAALTEGRNVTIPFAQKTLGLLG